MERYDWKANLDINIKILRFMGLWPSGESYKLDLYTIYSAIVVTLFVPWHVLAQVTNIYFVRDDLVSVAAIIYVILTELIGICKVYSVVTKMKMFKERIALFRSDWFQPKSHNQREIVERSIDFWKNIYKALLVMCLACNTFLLIYPLLDPSDGERRLPFLAWFPFDFKMSPYYEAAYVLQAASTSYLTLVHLNVDTMISGFNVFAGCQLDMLSDSLRTMDRDQAAKSLISCVEHHKQILRYVEGSSSFSSLILFWQLIGSGVSIGITMFQLTLDVPFSAEFYSILSYGMAILVQIFMYCWFGNEVEVKSNLVSYAAFESDWIGLPEDVKKNLLFFMQNVTQPVRISTFNMIYVSLETFMKILKTAWSYFALLHQLNSRN